MMLANNYNREDKQANQRLGQMIRYRREAAGMSQDALAAAIGVAQSMVGKYERGLTMVPATKFILIGRALGLPLKDLADDTEPPPPRPHAGRPRKG